MHRIESLRIFICIYLLSMHAILFLSVSVDDQYNVIVSTHATEDNTILKAIYLKAETQTICVARSSVGCCSLLATAVLTE